LHTDKTVQALDSLIDAGILTLINGGYILKENIKKSPGMYASLF